MMIFLLIFILVTLLVILAGVFFTKLFCLFFIGLTSILLLLTLMCLFFDRKHPLGKAAVEKAKREGKLKNGKTYASEPGEMAGLAKYALGPIVGLLVSFIFGYFHA